MIEFLGSNVVYNAVPLQQVMSNACEFYCIYYLLERASIQETVYILRNSDSNVIVKHMIYDRYTPLFLYIVYNVSNCSFILDVVKFLYDRCHFYSMHS